MGRIPRWRLGNGVYHVYNRSISSLPILNGLYSYAYDWIGNRTQATEAGVPPIDYTANLLNQYTEAEFAQLSCRQAVDLAGPRRGKTTPELLPKAIMTASILVSDL